MMFENNPTSRFFIQLLVFLFFNKEKKLHEEKDLFTENLDTVKQ